MKKAIYETPLIATVELQTGSSVLNNDSVFVKMAWLVSEDPAVYDNMNMTVNSPETW